MAPTLVLDEVEMIPADGLTVELAEFEEEFGDFDVEEIKAGGCSCTAIGTCCCGCTIVEPETRA